MSNTPLVNTSGRASAPTQRSSSCGARILDSNAGGGWLTPRLADGPPALRRRRRRRRLAHLVGRLAVLEHLHHLAHAAGGARDLDGIAGFLLGDDAHQV